MENTPCWAMRAWFSCLLFLAAPALAAEPRAVATFESVGIYYTPSSPPAFPDTSGCPVRFRKAGDSAWREGLALWYDARNRECRGSLVQLEPGTRYEIDLSGKILAATTWSDRFPVARTVKVPDGSKLEIRQGGNRDGYVVYEGGSIDGKDAEQYNIVIAAPYVIVRGFTLKGAKQDAIRLMPGAHDVVIEDNDISGWGRFRYVNSKGWKIGVDMDSGVRAVCSSGFKLERTVIQRNRIHHPRYGANSWSWDHPAGPQAITYSHCGGNHVIRWNEIYSEERRYFNDAIGGEDNFSDVGFPNADSDIYGNRISHAWDDAIEAEGANRNVRIWGNYLDRTATGVATTVTHAGPVYIFRNVYNRSRMHSERAPDADDRGPFAKAGSGKEFGDGRRYVFHNTLLQPNGNGGAGAGISGSPSEPVTNTVSRNNLWNIWKAHWEAIADAGGRGNDFGNDLRNADTKLGIDKGVRIANFNDSFIGAAPDIGAQETGAPALRFGLDVLEGRAEATLRTARKQ
jgi:hypothetical protein